MGWLDYWSVLSYGGTVLSCLQMYAYIWRGMYIHVYMYTCMCVHINDQSPYLVFLFLIVLVVELLLLVICPISVVVSDDHGDHWVFTPHVLPSCSQTLVFL